MTKDQILEDMVTELDPHVKSLISVVNEIDRKKAIIIKIEIVNRILRENFLRKKIKVRRPC